LRPMETISLNRELYILSAKSDELWQVHIHAPQPQTPIENFHHPYYFMFFFPVSLYPWTPLLAPGHHWTIFCHYKLDLSFLGFQTNGSLHSTLCLTPFAQPVSEVHSCCCMFQ
jgi:hypothetical protein